MHSLLLALAANAAQTFEGVHPDSSLMKAGPLKAAPVNPTKFHNYKRVNNLAEELHAPNSPASHGLTPPAPSAAPLEAVETARKIAEEKKMEESVNTKRQELGVARESLKEAERADAEASPPDGAPFKKTHSQVFLRNAALQKMNELDEDTLEMANAPIHHWALPEKYGPFMWDSPALQEREFRKYKRKRIQEEIHAVVPGARYAEDEKPEWSEGPLSDAANANGSVRSGLGWDGINPPRDIFTLPAYAKDNIVVKKEHRGQAVPEEDTTTAAAPPEELHVGQDAPVEQALPVGDVENNGCGFGGECAEIPQEEWTGQGPPPDAVGHWPQSAADPSVSDVAPSMEDAHPSIMEDAPPSIMEDAHPSIMEDAPPSIMEDAPPSTTTPSAPEIPGDSILAKKVLREKIERAMDAMYEEAEASATQPAALGFLRGNSTGAWGQLPTTPAPTTPAPPAALPADHARAFVAGQADQLDLEKARDLFQDRLDVLGVFLDDWAVWNIKNNPGKLAHALKMLVPEEFLPTLPAQAEALTP